MVVKKLKQKKNLKQKQKQKQNVKVSQNVKVVVGDLKSKTKRAKKSGGGAGAKKQSQERQSISLNIINPYQQLLPSPPQAQAQAQAQPQPQPHNTNPRNPANPNIVRQLSILNDQNANIRNDLRDLREFAKNQQQSYNYLLKAQKNEVPAESKTSKIDKMLKNKKLIMASMNWNRLLDNEDKSEDLILKEEKQAPVKFADPTDPILVRPNPILQRPIGPMPVAEPKPQRSLLSSWFSNIDWGNVIRESVDAFSPLLSSIQEQQQQEYEGIEEQKQEPNYLTLMGPSSSRLLIEEPNDPEPAIPQFRFEELLAEAKEEEGESEVKEQDPAQPAQISKRAQKRREYYRRRSEKKKQEAEGAGAGPPVVRRGRPPGSRNRPREVIQQEKREKENKKRNKK